jgi:hypothetical protein
MQDIDFDLAGARKAGAKPAQLSSYFKSNFNLDFDFDGAYKAGATDNQILSYLNQSYSDLKKKGNSGVESGVKSSPTPSKYTLKEEAPKKQYYSSKLDKGLIFDKEGQLYAPSSEALTKAIAPPAEDLNLKKSTQKDLVEQSRIPEEKPIKPVEEQGLLLNLVSALDKGFAKNYIGSPVKALGTALQGGTKKALGGTGEGFVSDALIKFGDYFNNAIDELTPQDEAFKNTLWDQFGQAFGQVASLIATGGMTGALGKAGQAAEMAAQIAPKGAAAATALKTLGSELSAPTAISAGLSMGQAEFDRAKQAGATDDQAFEVFYKNAAVGSVLETIPVMQFFKRFEKATAGGVANYLKTKGAAGLTGGIEEMTTEVLQQLYSNKTAKDIYNINQDIFDGVGSSGGVGFGVGFLLNAMGANAKILRKQGKIGDAKSIENQIKQFETKLENPASIKVLSTQIANQGSGQNVIANLNQDLANNVITPQEHQEAVNFAQKADAVAPKIPENISPDNKAKSIELLVERNDIKENNEILLQQKKASDEAYHAGINEEIKANDEKIKKINDEVFKIAKEPVVEEVEQPIVEEPVEVVEEQAVVEKPKLADKLSTFKEKYTLISEGAAKAIETKKINQQAGKIVPMNTEAAVLAWLSGNNELSWKAINDAAGRREQARLNVGKDYSTEEVKLRDYSAKKRNGGVGLRDAAHQIWQELTKRTGDKNITTRDVEGALLNAIRENPTRIDAAKNLISIAGAEEAPISIEEGVEDFYSRKGEQPTEPVVEQGMPEGGFVPFQEGEEEIPFSVQEIPTDEVNDMKEIVKDLVEEGLNLNAIRNRISKELGYDSKRLKETVNKAYQEYTKEYTPEKVTTGVIARIGQFISDLFGGKAEDKVLILKDAQSIFAKAEQMAETGGRVEFQATLPNGEKVTAKPVDASVVNGFYSPLELQINQMKADKMPAKQWLDKLKGEEAKWTGLVDWLSQQQSSLSKQEIKDWLQDNQIEINEIVKGRAEDLTQEQLDRLEYLAKIDAENPSGAMEDIEAGSYDEFLTLLNIRDKSSSNDLINLQKQAEQKARLAQQRGDKTLADKYWEDSHRYTSRHEVLELSMEGEGGILNPTKFSDLQLEGDKKDYTEILVTLPSNKLQQKVLDLEKIYNQDGSNFNLRELEEARKELEKSKTTSFRSSHFDEANILVHLRMNIRKDSQGKKVLFLEEVQSDWGQKGKKEGFQSGDLQKLETTRNLAREDVKKIDKEIDEYYDKNKIKKIGDAEENVNINAIFYSQYDLARRDEKFNKLLKTKGDKLEVMISAVRAYDTAYVGKPLAPFVTDTNTWTKLGLKVALKEAVKQGVDKVAWTTGEQQVGRYEDNFRKQVDKIESERYQALDRVKIIAYKNGSVVFDGILPTDGSKAYISGRDVSLEDVVGKDIAQKIKTGEQNQNFEGNQLTIGGSGMKGFYGSASEGSLGILGNMAKSLFKQEPTLINIKTKDTEKENARINKYRDELSDIQNKLDYLGRADDIVYTDDFTGERYDINKKELEDERDKVTAIIINSENKLRNISYQYQYSIKITPELKAQVEVGLPLFQYGRKRFDSLINNIKINGQDISELLNYVTDSNDLLRRLDYLSKGIKRNIELSKGIKDEKISNPSKELRNGLLKYMNNEIEYWNGELKNAKEKGVLNKDGDISDIKSRKIASYEQRLEKLKFYKDFIDNNLFKIDDLKINNKPLSFMFEDTVLGFTFNNKIYLNGESLNPNTPIHEAGHIWTEWVKQFDNKVYQRGIELVKNSEYLKEVKSSKFYQEQAKKLATKEEAELYFQHEALAMAIGDKGAQFVTESKRTSFKEWLDALWTRIRDLAGFKDITAEELQNVTFEEFTKMAVKDILGKQFEGRTLQEMYETLPMGKKLRQNKQEILIRDNFDNIVAELIKNNKIEKIC